MEREAPAPALGVDTALGVATGLFAASRAAPPRRGTLGALLRRCVAAVLAVLLAPWRWLAARRARASWAAANAILDEVLVAVRCAFPAMQPERTVPFESADGALRGEVSTWRGAPVDWCVLARVWSPKRCFGCARLDAFLDGSTHAPHLQTHITVLPGGAYLIYFDCPSRVDLLQHDAHLKRAYLAPPPGQPRSLADAVSAMLREPLAAPFVSRDGAVRAYMASPAAVAATLPSGRAGEQRVRALAREMTACWAALAKAPAPEGERVDSAELRRRDAAIRGFVRRDPDTRNLAPLLGARVADMLMQLLSGEDASSMK